MLGNAGIALYHTGVERDWWEGPSTCTGGGGDLGSMDVADLLNPDAGGGIVMCDEVAWEMFGLSMASWNGLACLALAAIWFTAMRRAPRPRWDRKSRLFQPVFAGKNAAQW
jgi:disulfide bond formation protein DsbB